MPVTIKHAIALSDAPDNETLVGSFWIELPSGEVIRLGHVEGEYTLGALRNELNEAKLHADVAAERERLGRCIAELVRVSGPPAEGALKPAPASLESAADQMHGVLMDRAEKLAGCVEDSEDETELEAIGAALEAYESARWPTGRVAPPRR